jgi:hypothetical protein
VWKILNNGEQMHSHRNIFRTIFSCIFFAVPDLIHASENPEPLKFAWASPSKFEVEETIRKKDGVSKLRHTFSFAQSNNEFVLKWLDAKCLSVNGQPINTPELDKAVLPMRAMFLAMPPMRVSLSGEFLGTVHSEESIEEINMLLDKLFPNRPEDARKYYSKAAQSAQGQAFMDATLANRYWRTWVETWEGIALSPGQTITNRTSIPIGGGAFSASNIIARLPSQDAGQIHIRFKQMAAGPQVGNALSSFVNSLTNLTGSTTNEPFPKIESGSIQTILEVETNPKTMQPSWAKRTIKTTIKTSEDLVTSQESYEYFFFWSTN